MYKGVKTTRTASFSVNLPRSKSRSKSSPPVALITQENVTHMQINLHVLYYLQFEDHVKLVTRESEDMDDRKWDIGTLKVICVIYRDSKKSKNPITLGWFRSLRTFISDSTISKCPLTVFFEMILIATSFLSLIRTALRTEPKEPRPNKETCVKMKSALSEREKREKNVVKRSYQVLFRKCSSSFWHMILVVVYHHVL